MYVWVVTNHTADESVVLGVYSNLAFAAREVSLLINGGINCKDYPRISYINKYSFTNYIDIYYRYVGWGMYDEPETIVIEKVKINEF